MAQKELAPEQSVLFLSFARATVARIFEAIEEESAISATIKSRIEVDTYHSFFWRILKAHGYLIGLPRYLSILTPPNEAIALSNIRRGMKAASKMTDAEKAEKAAAEELERERLAKAEGRVCFSRFAPYVAELLHGSSKLREVVRNAFPFVILDEFQDTTGEQWDAVRALGMESILLALADSEQRIFDFAGADPKRLSQFEETFSPKLFDLKTDNHRSKGTDIAAFGNHILSGDFGQNTYNGIRLVGFPSNANQAFATLAGHTLQARERRLKAGQKKWSVAILVPTKKMTRDVSDSFREPLGNMPAIYHTAVVDMEGVILAAELIALLLEQRLGHGGYRACVESICAFYRGKDGDDPSASSLKEADALLKAYETCLDKESKGLPPPKGSTFNAIRRAIDAVNELTLTGDPDRDWISIRQVLEKSDCKRLKKIAEEARNVRLLDRGTQLRQALSSDWRDNGAYRNALEITRLAFVQEHFAASNRPEHGVIVMNMHKAKGKQFDEVIIFEGWPRFARGKVVANTDRIVRYNQPVADMSQARQNFRVSVTRAKAHTTILTPSDDPCVLLQMKKGTA